jgi:uncharacterized protein YggL (DUF469 family)
MFVTRHNSEETSSFKGNPSFVHGFYSRFPTLTPTDKEKTLKTNLSDPIQKEKVCPDEQEKMRYKQGLSRSVVAALLRSIGNPLMAAQAERIERCNADDNLFVGEDFHTADGEAHNGKSSLWSCNSRFCPNCVGKLPREHRKVIRYVMENQKLMLGENWYFTTFTMPDLSLTGLPLPVIAAVTQKAWERFTSLETRKTKKPTWFQRTIRGGFKNAEFTINRLNSYHYHYHGLTIAKSSIQRDNFLEIRRQWTKALRYAFQFHGISWECRTGNKNFIPALLSFLWSKPRVGLLLNAHHQTKFFGLANVNVVKVDYSNREKVISELSKYVTKNDSWSKIPIEQIEEIVEVPRFWRMFEKFGVCRITAREMEKMKPASSLALAENSTGETPHQGENSNDEAYIYEKKLISRQNFKPKKKRRVPWRIRVREIPLWQYKIELANEIEEVQRFRRRQLRKKYSCAKFQTLDGREF